VAWQPFSYLRVIARWEVGLELCRWLPPICGEVPTGPETTIGLHLKRLSSVHDPGTQVFLSGTRDAEGDSGDEALYPLVMFTSTTFHTQRYDLARLKHQTIRGFGTLSKSCGYIQR
jgi:hypothetical protein